MALAEGRVGEAERRSALVGPCRSDGAVIYCQADFDPTGLAIKGWLSKQAASGSVEDDGAIDYLGWMSVAACRVRRYAVADPLGPLPFRS